MHAVQVSRVGGPDVLSNVTTSQPAPSAGEVLIKTEAIGVNFADVYTRRGQYAREVPFTVGAEACGMIEAVGDDVTALRVGDRVVTTQANGSYAEYCLAPAAFVAVVPDGVTSEVAAASLAKGLTAHFLVKSTYPVQPGEAVLVHAGAGGVGLILTQWATRLGARVISTVSTPEKAELAREAGAVAALEYPNDSAEFGAKVREITSGPGVTAVFDGVGQATFDASLASLAVRGTFVLFGAASGPVPPVDPLRLNAAGSIYFTRPGLGHYALTADEFSWRAREHFEAISNETIAVTIGNRYRLRDATQAHIDLETRKTVGALVLIP